MFSELECGICYRTYNAGRRCPRELQCKHSFCESCLLTLSRPRGPDEARQGADRSIVCPLCRHTTSITGEGRVRVELPVDECVLERLRAAGTLDEKDREEEADEGFDDNDVVTLPETPGEESESFAGYRGGRFRRSWRNVWRKISRRSSRQRGGENCITSDDMRNLALMSCYIF